MPSVYVGNYRSHLVYGNRVPSAGTYFSTLTGNFTPDGYPSMASATLRPLSSWCSSVSSCSFRSHDAGATSHVARHPPAHTKETS